MLPIPGRQGRHAVPLILAAALLLADAPPAPPLAGAAEEIVVTGNERKCRVVFADRALSLRALDRRAADWANGTPVRVILPRGASRKCMIQVGMRLMRRGVTRIDYVDRADAVAVQP